MISTKKVFSGDEIKVKQETWRETNENESRDSTSLSKESYCGKDNQGRGRVMEGRKEGGSDTQEV